MINKYFKNNLVIINALNLIASILMHGIIKEYYLRI